jgi:hypothetical protein
MDLPSKMTSLCPTRSEHGNERLVYKNVEKQGSGQH